MIGVNTIIWDWNGTLLNDTDICIETINELLNDRNLPKLDREKYLDVFGFPVIGYYQRIGFDFSVEPFDVPARQYIDRYSEKVKNCKLHESAISVLTFFKSKGFKQLVLSASEIGILENSIAHFKVDHFFDGIAGLDNHYATSKTEIGSRLLRAHCISPETACLIGDTIHDFEVASEIGCHCILVANGHQSLSKLMDSDAKVVEKLSHTADFF
jgi:phosphoglycolate phosphatase